MTFFPNLIDSLVSFDFGLSETILFPRGGDGGRSKIFASIQDLPSTRRNKKKKKNDYIFDSRDHLEPRL
jgi:hypothetical protein